PNVVDETRVELVDDLTRYYPAVVRAKRSTTQTVAPPLDLLSSPTGPEGNKLAAPLPPPAWRGRRRSSDLWRSLHITSSSSGASAPQPPSTLFLRRSESDPSRASIPLS